MNVASRRIAGAILALGMIFSGSGTLLSRTPSVLKEMSLKKDGNRLLIQLKIEGTYAMEASFLPSPPRLTIDLASVSEFQVLPLTRIKDTGVIDVRISQVRPDSLQAVFDLYTPAPAYEITQAEAGLKIAFWYDGGVPPVSEPTPAVFPAKTAEKPAAPVSAAPAEPGRSGFFIAGRAGLSFFMGSGLSVDKAFDLYSETGTLNESYSFGAVPAFELQFGKFFGRTKVGLGAAYSTLKQPGSYTGSFPHPFLADTPRTVVFESADLKNTIWEFSVFALFSLMKTEKMILAAGPMIGLNLGEMQSLENFDFAEEAPYDNVTVTNISYVADKFTEFSLGAVLNLEYRLNEGLSLLLDVRAVYLDPKNASLGRRVYLLHLQPALGIQYNF